MIAGTVLISRNNDESLNTSPGHWNHCAIYVGGGRIIHSLRDQGVVETVYGEWLAYDCTWVSLIPIDVSVGYKAAFKATQLVGLPYRMLSSVFLRARNLNRGINCVDAAVRVPYEYALGKSLSSIHWPDHVIELTGVFKKGPTSSD
jgi:uncharacterized protein YycO